MFLEKKQVSCFFSCLAFITLFQLSVGYVKINLSSNLLFRGLTFDFLFKFNSFSLLKRKKIPLSNSKNVKVTKKWNLIYIFLSGIKKLRFDPVFSNWSI